MPTDPAHTRARQQAEVLERLAAGETLKAACARPGMPRASSVSRWGAQDPVFRAAVEAAAARGDVVRRLGMDEARAAAVLERLRAGASMRAVERDPAMPSRRTLRHWLATHGGFAEEVHRLRLAADAGRGARLGAARRARTAWDGRVAERVLYLVGQGVTLEGLRAVDATLPSAYAVRGWRRARPDFAFDLGVNLKAGRLARARARRRARMEPVCAAIVAGASLAEVAGQDGFPHRSTLYGWVARDREIAGAVTAACDERVHGYADRMQMIAERLGPLDVGEARRQVKAVEARLGRLGQRPGKRRWRTTDRP